MGEPTIASASFREGEEVFGDAGSQKNKDEGLRLPVHLRHEIAGAALVAVLFFSSRRRHTRCGRDWSSDVCSSDLRLGRTWSNLLAVAVEANIAPVVDAET